MAATLGRFDEAMALDRRGLELDPVSIYHYDRGAHAYYAGRLDEAVAALKRQLELHPEYPGAHSLLGEIYLVQAHPQEALAEVERELDPPSRLSGLAVAYHALGRTKESDTALNELIAKYHSGAFDCA